MTENTENSTEQSSLEDGKIGAIGIRLSVIGKIIDTARLTASTPDETLECLLKNAQLPISVKTEFEARILRAIAAKIYAEYLNTPVITLEANSLGLMSKGCLLNKVKATDFGEYLDNLSEDEFDALGVKPFGTVDDMIEYIVNGIANGTIAPSDGQKLLCATVSLCMDHADRIKDALGFSITEIDRTEEKETATED